MKRIGQTPLGVLLAFAIVASQPIWAEGSAGYQVSGGTASASSSVRIVVISPCAPYCAFHPRALPRKPM
jgi:uncharacterized metal-binding protein